MTTHYDGDPEQRKIGAAYCGNSCWGSGGRVSEDWSEVNCKRCLLRKTKSEGRGTPEVKIAKKQRMAGDKFIMELVDEHGCELHTESLCVIPKEHEWFADWLVEHAKDLPKLPPLLWHPALGETYEMCRRNDENAKAGPAGDDK